MLNYGIKIILKAGYIIFLRNKKKDSYAVNKRNLAKKKKNTKEKSHEKDYIKTSFSAFQCIQCI